MASGINFQVEKKGKVFRPCDYVCHLYSAYITEFILYFYRFNSNNYAEGCTLLWLAWLLPCEATTSGSIVLRTNHALGRPVGRADGNP